MNRNMEGGWKQADVAFRAVTDKVNGRDAQFFFFLNTKGSSGQQIMCSKEEEVEEGGERPAECRHNEGIQV